MKKTTILIIMLIIGAMLLGACNLPEKQDQADADATTVAETAQAVFTRAAETAAAAAPSATLDDTASATVTPVPSNTPFPTQAATATKTPIPCNRASFVKDVTIPDNTAVKPGEVFTKTWRLKNTGSCTWTSGYVLLFDSGDKMNAPATSAITNASVDPGSTIDISLDLTAPAAAGTYQGNFKLRSPDNIVFGINADGQGPFWVKVVVAEATATPTATSFPVYSSGSANPTSSQTVDLDEGKVSPDAGNRDYWYEAVSAAEQYITPQNGATFVVWGNTAPSKTQCAGAALLGNKIALNNSLVGQHICYKTNLGRYGYFKITAFDSSTLTTTYTTWESP